MAVAGVPENGSTPTLYGTVIELYLGSNTHLIDVYRAPDDGSGAPGEPGAPNGTGTRIALLPAGTRLFQEYGNPSDSWHWYRFRHRYGFETPSAYTPWIAIQWEEIPANVPAAPPKPRLDFDLVLDEATGDVDLAVDSEPVVKSVEYVTSTTGWPSPPGTTANTDANGDVDVASIITLAAGETAYVLVRFYSRTNGDGELLGSLRHSVTRATGGGTGTDTLTVPTAASDITYDGAGNATIDLTITDPDALLQSVEFRSRTGVLGAWSSWTADTAPYSTTVALSEKHVVHVQWRLTYTDPTGQAGPNVQAVDTITLDVDDIPELVALGIDVDDAGNVTVEYTGDDDVGSIRYVGDVSGYKIRSTVQAGTVVAGRSASFDPGSIGEGSTRYVTILAYSDAAGGGRESVELYQIKVTRPSDTDTQLDRAPFVRESISYDLAGNATLSLTVDDPDGLVTDVEFRDRVGSVGPWSAWTSDAAPYAWTVALSEKHDVHVEYRISFTDPTGTGSRIISGSVTLDRDEVPEITSIDADSDDAGNVELAYTGDDDVQSIRYATSTSSYPDLDTTRSGTVDSSGRSNELVVGSISEGQTLYVSVLAYSETAAGGFESPILYRTKATRPTDTDTVPDPEGQAGASFMTNPGFELGDKTGWGDFGRDAGTVVNVGTDAHSGSYVLEVASAAGGPNQATKRLAVRGGAKLWVTGYGQRKETDLPDADGTLRVRAYDSTETEIGSKVIRTFDRTVSGWQSAAGYYVVPPNTRWVVLDFGEASGTSGTWQYDDAGVLTVVQTEPIVESWGLSVKHDTGDVELDMSLGGTGQSIKYAIQASAFGSISAARTAAQSGTVVSQTEFEDYTLESGIAEGATRHVAILVYSEAGGTGDESEHVIVGQVTRHTDTQVDPEQLNRLRILNGDFEHATPGAYWEDPDNDWIGAIETVSPIDGTGSLKLTSGTTGSCAIRNTASPDGFTNKSITEHNLIPVAEGDVLVLMVDYDTPAAHVQFKANWRDATPAGNDKTSFFIVPSGTGTVIGRVTVPEGQGYRYVTLLIEQGADSVARDYLFDNIRLYKIPAEDKLSDHKGSLSPTAGADDGSGVKILPKGVKKGTVAHGGSVTFADTYQNAPDVELVPSGCFDEQRSKWSALNSKTVPGSAAKPSGTAIYVEANFATTASGFDAELLLRSTDGALVNQSDPLGTDKQLNTEGEATDPANLSGATLPAVNDTYKCAYDGSISTNKVTQLSCTIALEVSTNSGSSYTQIASAEHSQSFGVGGGTMLVIGTLSGTFAGLTGATGERMRVKLTTVDGAGIQTVSIDCGPNVTWRTAPDSRYASMTPESTDVCKFAVRAGVGSAE